MHIRDLNQEQSRHVLIDYANMLYVADAIKTLKKMKKII